MKYEQMTENGNFRVETRRRKGEDFIECSFFSAPLRLCASFFGFGIQDGRRDSSTACSTVSMESSFMQRKSMGHSRR